jgi:hypothetical protein
MPEAHMILSVALRHWQKSRFSISANQRDQRAKSYPQIPLIVADINPQS